NSFDQQSDPKVEDGLANTTKGHIYLVKQKFSRSNILLNERSNSTIIRFPIYNNTPSLQLPDYGK
ncbi:hypothetical protein V8F44DRAFT_499533, partial [Aspergillus fumigatus]